MCERSVPQAAIPPPQMTIDDTNSGRNHKALSDYKHNESLTYYCWLNGAMGKVDCSVSQEFSRCFISLTCLHFKGSLWALAPLFFFSVCSSGSFSISWQLWSKHMCSHAFAFLFLPVVVLPSLETQMCPPPPRSCVFDKNLPGLFFSCRQPLTISSSTFNSLHSVICALNKPRSVWTLTRTFACANILADVMRVCAPYNMVPIMCLSFAKLEQYSTMTDECCAHRGIYGHMYRKTNELCSAAPLLSSSDQPDDKCII